MKKKSNIIQFPVRVTYPVSLENPATQLKRCDHGAEYSAHAEPDKQTSDESPKEILDMPSLEELQARLRLHRKLVEILRAKGILKDLRQAHRDDR